MKKCIAFAACVIIIILLSASMAAALGENTDLTGMSIDELILLRAQIDAEIISRPEAEDSVLLEGEYTVGVDIKPGTYFVTCDKSNNGWIGIDIYSDSTKENQIGDHTIQTKGYDVQKVTFSEGDYVEITHGSLLINISGFPAVKKPEGTEVQPGVYEANVDIPVGKYTVFHGDGYAVVSVFPDYKTFESEKHGDLTSCYLEHNNEQTNIILSEGNILVIEGNAVVMTKSSGMLNIE